MIERVQEKLAPRRKDAKALGRRWWRKKRWWPVLALWLLLCYPLSAGPVQYAANRGWLQPSALTWHLPVAKAVAGTPIQMPYARYVAWWWAAATGLEVTVSLNQDGHVTFNFKDPAQGRRAASD